MQETHLPAGELGWGFVGVGEPTNVVPTQVLAGRDSATPFSPLPRFIWRH